MKLYSTKINLKRNIFRICLLFFLFGFKAVSAQDTLSVSGMITGGQGEPVKGVSVSVEGVRLTPVITDSAGRFELEVPEGDQWLLIDPLEGFKSRRVFLNNRNQLKIQLTPVDMESGYDQVKHVFGSKMRRNLISAANAPDPGQQWQQVYHSIDQQLQGKIAGLWATDQDGMSNSGTSAYLRGIKSLYTTNQPLYIIDGQPVEVPGIFQSQLSGYTYNPLSMIDPMDISNITILKDYLAGALYGMRGSNGVVLIETLQPNEVKTTIDFSVRTGLSFQPENIPQLNSMQYKTLANDVLMTSGMYEEDYREEYFPIFRSPDDPDYYKYDKNTNWQDEIFRNGVINDAYLRISGGDQIARYGLSIGYSSHEGIIRNTSANRFNVRFVGSFNVFSWMRMFVSSTLVNSQSSLRESSLSPETSPILTALSKSPLLHPYQYDDNGEELRNLEEVNSLGVSNPISVIEKFEGNQKNYRFANSFRLEAELVENALTLTSLFGITTNALNESVFMPNRGMELYYDEEVYNAAKSTKNHFRTIYSDNYLSYKQEFGNKHVLTSATGIRVYHNKFEIDWGIGKNAHERDEYKQLQNGVSFLREMGGANSIWNRLGVYTNAGYSFRNKYFVSANINTETSTRIGDNARDLMQIGNQPFGFFYSFGGAWRLSSEDFLKNLFWMEDLKLRASYGKVGNDDVGSLSSLNYYTVDHYRGTTGMIPGPLADQSVKFEVNKQINAGLDLSLFGSRINFALDLYRTTTEDLLVFEPQPSFIGSATLPVNNGKVSNKGWEAGFNSRIINMDKLKWTLGFNISAFDNQLEEIKDGEVISPFKGGYYISRVGEPVISFYGYQFEGVFATTEEAATAGLVTEKGIPYGAGDAKYADLSGSDGTPDGVINELDRTIIGSPVPDIFGGMSSTISYGRWALSVNVLFVTGQEVFNYLRYQNEKMIDLDNQSTSVLKRWTGEGQVTDVPRASYNDPLGNSDFSSRWIEDGSYIRLKHLTLSYTIPEKKWFFRNLEVFATAKNLYTWSKYLGYDPEFSFSYFTMEQGIDYGMVPHGKKFILGFKVGL